MILSFSQTYFPFTFLENDIFAFVIYNLLVLQVVMHLGMFVLFMGVSLSGFPLDPVNVKNYSSKEGKHFILLYGFLHIVGMSLQY